jgi:hypothetical protein
MLVFKNQIIQFEQDGECNQRHPLNFITLKAF